MGSMRRSRSWVWLLCGLVLVLVAAVLWGVDLFQQGQARDQARAHGTVSVDSEGKKAAPTPTQTYQNEKCSGPVSSPGVSGLKPNQWSIPSIHQSASFQDDEHGTAPVLPDAPGGVRYGPSMPVGSGQGATVLAGHVDYGPGVLSVNGGELSPWGHLHDASPCDAMVVTDMKGKAHQYRVTAMYTRDQDQLPKSELFRSTGSPAVYLVTCSGPSTQDAGGKFQFNYKYNLIIKAEPVG